MASMNYKHRSIARCKKRFDILNRLNVGHERDGRTDRTAIGSSAV